MAEQPDFIGHSAPPPHYAGAREGIDQIRDLLGDVGFIAYCRGNAHKYLSRAGKKGDAREDLDKARWYNQMANHVAGVAGVTDPRAYREGFTPYERPLNQEADERDVHKLRDALGRYEGECARLRRANAELEQQLNALRFEKNI